MNLNVISVAVAALISAAVGRLMIRLGPALGWVDQPDDPALKAHRLAAVPLGGIGIWLAVNAGAWIAGVADLALAGASLVLLVIGLVDDRRSVPPLLRLGAETVAGLVLGAGHDNGWKGTLLVALLLVIAVNAVNLLDGLDGLAGSTGLVASIGIGMLAISRGARPWFAFVVGAALVGFLVWNWHPARLFLGDNGAYVLAAFLVNGIDRASPSAGSFVVASALLGVFFIDMATTLFRRMLSRQPLFSRDRLHLYDRLADMGVPIPQIAAASAALQAVWVALVIAADRFVATPTAIAALVVLGAVLVAGLVRFLGATRPGHWVRQ